MKLFQKLLLAPTAIGLFAPITASASEANLMDVSSYSQVDVEVTQDTFKPLSTKNPLLAGGEGLGQDLTNDFDGDSFSSTTSATFASNWAIGSVDGTLGRPGVQEKVATTFDWSLSTITSFTGNDSLDVTLKGGSGDVVLTELDFYGSTRAADGDQDEIVGVDSISYTSAVGDYLTYFFGFGVDGSYLYNTACAYEAQTEVFSSCGLDAVGLDAGYGTNFGATIDVGNGLFVSVGYEGQGTTAAALMSEEGQDHFGGQVAYIQDNWGLSLSASARDYATQPATTVNTTRDYTALNGFFIPGLDGFPSISFGYEWSHLEGDGVTDDNDNTTNYFVGFQFDDLGNGTLGVAVGSKAPVVENLDAETMWEAYYAYNYADGITITPLVFVKEEADDGVDDETGIILKTSFEF